MEGKHIVIQREHKSKLITRATARKMFRALEEGREFTVTIREDGRRIVHLVPKPRKKHFDANRLPGPERPADH
jgi:hypothetical protein